MRTPAEIKAQQKYDKTRGKRPQISIRLNEYEKNFCEEIFNKLNGSKKEIVIRALKELEGKEL